MIMERKDLYEYLHNSINGEYCVGMHGINEERLRDFHGNTTPEYAIRNIIENGLNVYSGRTINGTVRFFGRLDLEEEKLKVQRGLEHYYYPANNFVIVAIPSILRTKSGKEVFIGSPNLDSEYKRHFDSTGNETTTLLETVVLNSNGISHSTIPSEFIVGVIRNKEDGTVEYMENSNHISKTDGYVSEEFYNNALKTISIDLFPDTSKIEIFKNFKNIDEKTIREYIEQLEEELSNTSNDIFFKEGIRQAYILETLKQLLRERELYKSEEQKEQEQKEQELKLKTKFFNQYKYFVTNEFNCQDYYNNDINFVIDAIKYLDDEDLKNYINRFKDKIPKEVYNNKDVIKRLITIDISLLGYSDLKSDLDTMLELSKIKGIPTSIFKYIDKELLNNQSLVINILLNTENILDVLTPSNEKYNESTFKYREYIGIELLNNRMFWELLNGLIRKEAPNANEFKVEKELEISKQQQEKLNARFNTGIQIEKTDYFNHGEGYVLRFNYDNVEQRAYIKEIFKEIIDKYGYRSKHQRHCIMPYLVDQFDMFTTEMNDNTTIGGTNLPEETMNEILKLLVEKFHCVIKHNDLEIKEEFNEVILQEIIEDLNKSTMK